MLEPRVTSLYVHVPFCAQKCSYCAFYSEPSKGDLINRYVSALVKEFSLVAQNLQPRTVFFGGGTPSLLTLRQWETIFGAMDRLGLSATEWTIECNPATVSLDKARLWLERGVNRVSMGVQSLDEQLLDRLGRIHSREMVFKSYDILRSAGFSNVNIDLMFGLPGQSMEHWRRTLEEALAMRSEHLACYEVIYEEDTPLFEQLRAGEFEVNEDLNCAMYDELVERAHGAGLQHYEIANFARGPSPFPLPQGEGAGLPRFACRHNVNYWRGGEYYGLGPSAASYVAGERTKNWSNTTLYCEQLEKGVRAIESRETLPPLRRAGETAAFGLRMNMGWPFVDFQRATGFDLREEWRGEMAELARREWGVSDGQRFHLTPAGLRFADAAAEMFLR